MFSRKSNEEVDEGAVRAEKIHDDLIKGWERKIEIKEFEKHQKKELAKCEQLLFFYQAIANEECRTAGGHLNRSCHRAMRDVRNQASSCIEIRNAKPKS